MRSVDSRDPESGMADSTMRIVSMRSVDSYR